MIDMLNDRTEFLYQQIGQTVDPAFLEEIRDQAKTAGVHGFADQKGRTFPIFNEKAAALSSMYVELQSNVPDFVRARIKEALDLYNIEVETPITGKKVAATIDDDDFLIPTNRKILVQTPEQVKTAEAALHENQENMNILVRTFAFRRLREKATKLGESLEEISMPYAAESRCNVAKLCSEIQKRRMFTNNETVKQAFLHLESSLRSTGAQHISNQEEQDKIAQLLLELDEEAGIQHRYNRKGKIGFSDPILSVFNTKESASSFMNLGNKEIPLNKLTAMDPRLIADIVGDEFLDDIKNDSGEVDPETMMQTLSILPSDMQEDIVQRLGL